MNLKQYGPYREPEEIYAFFRVALGGIPGYEEFDLGRTWEGRALRAWTVGPADAPSVLYFAGVHAVEFIGIEQCAAVAGALAASRRDLLERVRFWFFPVMNPDGHARVRTLLKRRAIPLVKTNSRRVDLNRNFPVGFHDPHRGGVMAGSHSRIINYHGPRPLSEPESKALASLVDKAQPAASLSFHSFGEKILFPPCRRRGDAPDHELFSRVGRSMAALQPKPYRVMRESDMYLTYGDIADWLYEERKTLAFTMEIGHFGMGAAPPESWWNVFAWANPRDARAMTNGNLGACLRLAEAVARGARAGAPPDVDY